MTHDNRSRRRKCFWVGEHEVLDICSGWLLKPPEETPVTGETLCKCGHTRSQHETGGPVTGSGEWCSGGRVAIDECECQSFQQQQFQPYLTLPVWGGLPDGASLQYVLHDQLRQAFGFVCSHPDWPEVPNGMWAPDAEGDAPANRICVRLEYVRTDDETPVYRVSGTTLDEQIESAVLGITNPDSPPLP